MITSAARLCQLSPFNSVQTEAVPRIGSRGLPRKVKLHARSEPPSRSVNPSDSEVCASEMPVAVPATFHIECCPGHSLETLARIFPPEHRDQIGGRRVPYRVATSRW